MKKITGDCHGVFDRIKRWCIENSGTTIADMMFILGDVGVNYLGYIQDQEKKRLLAGLPLTFFCIHGNHEMRPESLPYYHEIEFHGAKAYVEDEFPNIIFAKDGEIYDFEGVKTLVLGGAYSVDWYIRFLRGLPWFPDEQPSDEIKRFAEKQLDECGWKVDVVLSHTAPEKYEPTETFIEGLDQSKVNKSTEKWLDKIEQRLEYQHWFCGHYHTVKDLEKIHFLFENYVDFPEKEA